MQTLKERSSYIISIKQTLKHGNLSRIKKGITC